VAGNSSVDPKYDSVPGGGGTVPPPVVADGCLFPGQADLLAERRHRLDQLVAGVEQMLSVDRAERQDKALILGVCHRHGGQNLGSRTTVPRRRTLAIALVKRLVYIRRSTRDHHMPLGSPIRVLLAEDHPMMRQSLRIILQSFPRVLVVGESITGEDAVVNAAALQPDIVLMDINIPLLDGIAATRQIKTRHPHIAVIGLTCHAQGNTVNAMTNAGAFHVLPKEKALELYAIMERAVTGSAMLRGGFPEHPPSGTSLGR